MSRVIDGVDILYQNSYIAGAMSQSLDDLLNGKETKIPAGVLDQAKRLFSVGMGHINEISAGSAELKAMTTYQLLRDMLRKVDSSLGDVDSELESLAVAAEALTPDGRQIKISAERYSTIQNLFKIMFEESKKYNSQPGNRSPYCTGTFDDDDDE